MNNRENEQGNRNEAKSPNQEQSQPSSVQLLEVAQFRADQANENLSNAKDDSGRKNLERVAKQHNGALSALKSLARENLTLDQLKEKAYATREELVMEEAADESDQKAIDRELRKVDDVIRFLDNYSPDAFKMESFRKWQEKKTNQTKEQKREVQIAEQVINEQEVKEARLILEIITEGGVGAHTSLPREYHPNHSAGFTDIIDNRLLPNSPGGFWSKGVRDYFGFRTFGNDLTRNYEKAQVREFIGFKPVSVDVYQDKKVQVAGGMFGLKKTTQTIKEKTGIRPLMHNEAVASGVQEPLVKLIYFTRELSSDINSLLAHKDYSGRDGNHITMEVLLPQSVAEKVQQEIKVNPTFIRKIAKELMVQKLGIPEKVWEEGDTNTHGHPVRPPYEKWDASGENIYIRDDNDNELDFKPERVIKVQPEKK
jgi:hypothetical protein